MKIFIFILLSFSPFLLFSQNNKIVYFGVNGKVESIEKAKIRKEIKHVLFKKVKVITSKADEDDWQFLFSEKIKFIDDSTYKIKIRSDEFSGRIKRQFEK